MKFYNLTTRNHLEAWPGVTFFITISGMPVELSNCEVSMRFKRVNRDRVEWLLSSESNDIRVEGHKITVIPRVLTLSPGKYTYELQISRPNGSTRTCLKGTFEVK